jgi:hypothetical protein
MLPTNRKAASGSEETIYLTIIVRKDGQSEHGPVATHSTQHLVCTETTGIVCTRIVAALGRVEGLMCRFQNHERGISKTVLNQLMAFGTFIFSCKSII